MVVVVVVVAEAEVVVVMVLVVFVVVAVIVVVVVVAVVAVVVVVVVVLGGRPKSRQSVKSRCNAAFPHGDARTGESHSTCPKVTAQVANPHVDARFDMASQQKENCSIRWK